VALFFGSGAAAVLTFALMNARLYSR